MIVYREFSSLIKDLGFSGKTLYSLSNNIHKHYRAVKIPKENGEFRQLHVPDAFLKSVQHRINEKLLFMEEISPYATAYRCGGSTKVNANPHIGKRVVLKLDIKNFFDNLIYPIIKDKAFPEERYSEQNRVLLALLCVYKESLPQGAPTSPTISNIIMCEFDNAVGEWCRTKRIAYTRYCDDMTFSGDFDVREVKSFVKSELRKLGLFLNDRKTVTVRKGQKQIVTGIVVNSKLNIPKEYKTKIRQEMYYCMKYGVDSHLEKCGITDAEDKYVLKLLGRVNYVLSVEPKNQTMKKYREWLSMQMQ